MPRRDLFSGLSYSETYYNPNTLPGGDSFDVPPRNDRSSMGRQLLSTQKSSRIVRFTNTNRSGLFLDKGHPQDLQLMQRGSLGAQAESRFRCEPTPKFAKAIRFPSRSPSTAGMADPPTFGKTSFDSRRGNEPAFSWPRADRQGPEAKVAADTFATAPLDTMGRGQPPVYASAPQLSMSGRQSFGSAAMATREEGPGPAAFNPRSMFGDGNPTMAKTPSVLLGKDSRFRNNVHLKRKKQAPMPEEPGPGSYDVSDAVVRAHAPAASIGARVKFGSTLVENLASAVGAGDESEAAPRKPRPLTERERKATSRLYSRQTSANKLRELANAQRSFFPSVWD